jgi:hypothetical protein
MDRVEEVCEMIVDHWIKTRSANNIMSWGGSFGIRQVLLKLPEFQPPTWNDPKVSQPEKGKWFVIKPFETESDCTGLFLDQVANYPWHYVSIAPIPEPESELVKWLDNEFAHDTVSLKSVIAKVKEFEAKKKGEN